MRNVLDPYDDMQQLFLKEKYQVALLQRKTGTVGEDTVYYIKLQVPAINKNSTAFTCLYSEIAIGRIINSAVEITEILKEILRNKMDLAARKRVNTTTFPAWATQRSVMREMRILYEMSPRLEHIVERWVPMICGVEGASWVFTAKPILMKAICYALYLLDNRHWKPAADPTDLIGFYMVRAIMRVNSKPEEDF